VLIAVFALSLLNAFVLTRYVSGLNAMEVLRYE
jgi:hypothetical protein